MSPRKESADGGPTGGRRRGQVILLAAVAIALALVPALLAYLQLGYHADVTASGAYGDPTRDAERVLERSVYEASRAVTGNYTWGRRPAAAAAVHAELAPRTEELAASRVERGVAYEVSYNASAARSYAAERCPRGDGRRFGPCDARDGVVLQRRAGETHVVAVAVDLRVVAEDRAVAETVVITARGRTVRSV